MQRFCPVLLVQEIQIDKKESKIRIFKGAGCKDTPDTRKILRIYEREE